MKRSLFSLLLGLGLAWAQFPVTESFMNSTAPGWVFGGYRLTHWSSPTRLPHSAYLTSGKDDPAGQGWLRLTHDRTFWTVGYAYYDTALPSTLPVRIEFDFLAWGGSSVAPDGSADGIALFLFDGATTSFRIGAPASGLGYCPSSTGLPGLGNAYVGIGFDEFGHFSSSTAYQRCSGNPFSGRAPNNVTIRGPESAGYPYLTGTGQNLGGTPLTGTTLDYPTPTSTRPSPSVYYRRARVDLVPIEGKYQITVYLATKPNGPFYRILGPYTMPSPPPPTLKVGFAAGTGGGTNNHEIRNVSIILGLQDFERCLLCVKK